MLPFQVLNFVRNIIFLSLSKSSLSLHYSWLTAIRDGASVASLLWSQHQFILSASDIGNHKTRNYTTVTIDYWNPPALTALTACVHPQLPVSINFTLKFVKQSGPWPVTFIFHLGHQSSSLESWFQTFQSGVNIPKFIAVNTHTVNKYISLKMDQN